MSPGRSTLTAASESGKQLELHRLALFYQKVKLTNEKVLNCVTYDLNMNYVFT